MRVPVLKTCKDCGGKGQKEGFFQEIESTCGNYTSWDICQECEGRGVVETDMFIDVDYNLPFIIEVKE